MPLYLDCAASAPPFAFPDAFSARAFPSVFVANPSSSHPAGEAAAQLLAQQRSRLAALLGVGEGQIVFCSGATEANHLAIYNFLLPALLKPAPKPSTEGSQRSRVAAWGSSLDHPSVRGPLQALKPFGLELSEMPLGADGSLLLERSFSRCSASDTSGTLDTLFCSVNAVDGETGRLQNLLALGAAIRAARTEFHGRRRLYVHADLAQYAACAPSPGSLGALLQDFDSLTLSAHKFGGLRGAGILLQRQAPAWSFSQGGGQEHGLRSGTENLSAICSAVAALEQSFAQQAQQQRRSEEFLALLDAYPDLTLEPAFRRERPGDFSPFIFSLSTGLPAEVMQRLLGERGFIVGTGAACSSKARGRASRLAAKLSAQGYRKENLASVLRISFGNGASEPSTGELQYFLDTITELRAKYGAQHP